MENQFLHGYAAERLPHPAKGYGKQDIYKQQKKQLSLNKKRVS